MEDFCQLSENLTEHKYRGSIEKVGKLTYNTANKGFEVQRLFELVLFNYNRKYRYAFEKLSLIENTLGEYELTLLVIY